MSSDLLGLAGVALASFVSTDVDNLVITSGQMAVAPPERLRAIAFGQLAGFSLLVAASAVAAAVLFDVPVRWIGLLGLVPLTLGVRALVALRRPDASAAPRWPVAGGALSAGLITIGNGGDNLAVYIPLFRGTGGVGTAVVVLVLLAADLVLLAIARVVGRHRTVLAGVERAGHYVIPFQYLAIGVAVLLRAGTIPGL